MSAINRPAVDADPYLHYLAGLVHGLELRVEELAAIVHPTGLAVRIELLQGIGSLERRVDGLEAVAGELRARVDRIELGAKVALEELELRILELERMV